MNASLCLRFAVLFCTFSFSFARTMGGMSLCRRSIFPADAICLMSDEEVKACDCEVMIKTVSMSATARFVRASWNSKFRSVTFLMPLMITVALTCFA